MKTRKLFEILGMLAIVGPIVLVPILGIVTWSQWSYMKAMTCVLFFGDTRCVESVAAEARSNPESEVVKLFVESTMAFVRHPPTTRYSTGQLNNALNGRAALDYAQAVGDNELEQEAACGMTDYFRGAMSHRGLLGEVASVPQVRQHYIDWIMTYAPQCPGVDLRAVREEIQLYQLDNALTFLPRRDKNDLRTHLLESYCPPVEEILLRLKTICRDKFFIGSPRRGNALFLGADFWFGYYFDIDTASCELGNTAFGRNPAEYFVKENPKFQTDYAAWCST